MRSHSRPPEPAAAGGPAAVTDMEALPDHHAGDDITGGTRARHVALGLGIVMVALMCMEAAGIYRLTTIAYEAAFIAAAFTPLFLGIAKPPSSRTMLWLGRLVFLPALLAVCAYSVLNAGRLTNVLTDMSTTDFLAGAIFALLTLEIIRRTLGYSFLALLAVLGAYLVLQPHLSGTWGGRGTTLEHFVQSLYLGSSGLWGTVTQISTLLVAVFVLFGELLLITGAGRPLFSAIFVLTRRMRGGVAKGCLLTSGLFGMLNGSSAANAATTGSFTIPMMLRAGYPRRVAAAVESVASTGGQIVPPVMGAGAFIIAQFLGVSYGKVLVAGILPAILYYLQAYLILHGLAGRLGHGSLAKARESDPAPAEGATGGAGVDRLRFPKPLELVRVLVPFAVLVVLLLRGRAAENAAFWAIVAVMAAYALAEWHSPARARRGIATLRPAVAGVVPRLASLVALGLASQFLVAMIGISGLGPKLTGLVSGATGDSALLALIIAALVTTFLGMGVATTADFVVASAVMGPVLLALGVKPLAMYLFIFYFACSSSLTPPVCASVYVSATIAGTDWWRTSLRACVLGASLMIMPFVYALHPQLLTGPVDGWFVLRTAGLVAAAWAISQVVTGWARRRISLARRVLMVAVAAGGLALGSTAGLLVVIGVAALALASDALRGRPRVAWLGHAIPVPSAGRSGGITPPE